MENDTDTAPEFKPAIAQKEHQWLQQMLGEWTSEIECSVGPDQPAIQTKGTEAVRPLGDLWVIAEGTGETPGGGTMNSMMTLGFDPQKGKFVGTFIATGMSNLWVYEGSLDEGGTVLTLDTEGPALTGAGTGKYQDIVEFPREGGRILRSQMAGPDGNWIPFMTAMYQRKG